MGKGPAGCFPVGPFVLFEVAEEAKKIPQFNWG